MRLLFSSKVRASSIGLFVAALVVSMSPSANAGPWTLGQGTLQLKADISLWQTVRRFASETDEQSGLFDPPAESGDRVPFAPAQGGGQLSAYGLELQARLGLIDWIDLDVAVPLIALDLDTSFNDTLGQDIGIGDVRVSVWLRAPIELPVQIAVRLEGKLPTGDFDSTAYEVPLSEGQLDLTGWLSVGASLPAESWFSVDAGYRLRLENPDNNRNPGEELHLNVEFGTRLAKQVAVKAAADALLGETGEIGEADIAPRRRAFSGWVGIAWNLTDAVAVDLSGRWFFAGEDFPTGFQFFAGLRGELALY